MNKSSATSRHERVYRLLRRASGGPAVLVGIYLTTSNFRSILFHLTKQMPDMVPIAKSPLDVLQIEWNVFTAGPKQNWPSISRKARPALTQAMYELLIPTIIVPESSPLHMQVTA